MTQSKPSKPTVVLTPPRLTLGKLSNRYTIIVDLDWGEFSKHIEVSLELANPHYKLVEELNQALLEGSESKPYLLA